MKKLKMFVCAALAVALAWQGTAMVNAATTHVTGCSNTTYTYAECGDHVDTVLVNVHTAKNANGQVVQCRVYEDLYLHDLLCANSSCRAVMDRDVLRPCTRTHYSCSEGTKNDVCKTEY